MHKIDCLDFGYVKLLNLASPVSKSDDDWPCNAFGADITDIAKSARISFNNFEKDRTREQDLKLVKYLITNQHWTPVEMIETYWEMKLPIFLARQFVRHRTATINEVSARYSTLPEEFYIPANVGGKPTKGAKQGQEDNLTDWCKSAFQTNLETACKYSYNCYKSALDAGVAPEHARLFLHVNHYTTWIWKQDLRNLIHFLRLRLDAHAQVEARIYAKAMLDLLTEEMPEITEILFGETNV